MVVFQLGGAALPLATPMSGSPTVLKLDENMRVDSIAGKMTKRLFFLPNQFCVTLLALCNEPGSAPRGAFRSRAPPNDCLCPVKRKLNCALLKRGLCPEEINRLGATGVQIEAQVGVCQRYFRNFCGLTPDFMTFLGPRPFFLLEITCFRLEKPFEFLISAGISF